MRRCQNPEFNATSFWQARRQTVIVRSLLSTLHQMSGDLHRCMYCMNSEADDIEHFWPKSKHHNRMFLWDNLLLCCTICGRKKGDQFPLEVGEPLLIDPSAEDPWRYLEFDPQTGNIIPRLHPNSGEELRKGSETVRVFELDRREALAKGFKKTFRRLSSCVNSILNDGFSAESIVKLRSEDDHGLLQWCFCGSGQFEQPFSEMRDNMPGAWAACRDALC